MPSLLVTNDFPPKVGGIQSYLYELWRRLPAADTTVMTPGRVGAEGFDAAERFRILRTREPVLFPTRSLARRIDELAAELETSVTFFDPLLPLGLVMNRVARGPRVVVAHGAEITLPGRVPVARGYARRALRGADAVVAAGRYPARVINALADGDVPGVVIPPGVDTARFHPVAAGERGAIRRRLGLDPDRPLVLGVSRLVPRKGFDLLIDAVAGLADVQLAIAGTGRDRGRLLARAKKKGIEARVHFLGRVDDADLPAVYACADVFAMLCRDRWGGLEAEGFGIVFLEAAACGLPTIVGRSGGAPDAVDDGVTGYVVNPISAGEVRERLAAVIDDDGLRNRLGEAGRRRAVEEFSYDQLARRLLPLAEGRIDGLAPLGA